MSAIYIGANNCIERGYFLGDVLVGIKCAWLFIQNEPSSHVILSLIDRDPLNFLWQKFIADNEATVVFEAWPKGDIHHHYGTLNRRLEEMAVRGIPFATYKELYTRMDGGNRQHRLCGSERGLGRKNVFEYYYYGQATFQPEPKNTTDFGPDVIDIPPVERTHDRSVLIAPHEKCQGNRIFTHEFWTRVVRGLLDAQVEVTVNDQGGFMESVVSPRFHRSFLPFVPLIAQVAAQRLVVSGNTGLGWVAAAVGTPLIAMEKDMLFSEYSFQKCGCRSLKRIIEESDSDRVIAAILHELDSPS